MYWIVDVIVILLMLIAVIRGLKKGFFNTSYEIVGNLIVLAFSVCLCALITLLFYKMGTIDQMKVYFIRVIGETNLLMEKLSLTSEKVAYFISLGIVAILSFVFSYIVVLCLHKCFLRLMLECRENKFFCFIDSFVGVVVNSCLVGIVVLGTFGFIHAFNNSDFLVSADEVLRACPLSSLIYEHNPLNSAIANTGIATKIVSIFS